MQGTRTETVLPLWLMSAWESRRAVPALGGGASPLKSQCHQGKGATIQNLPHHGCLCFLRADWQQIHGTLALYGRAEAEGQRPGFMPALGNAQGCRVLEMLRAEGPIHSGKLVVGRPDEAGPSALKSSLEFISLGVAQGWHVAGPSALLTFCAPASWSMISIVRRRRPMHPSDNQDLRFEA
jgi:hypothetical protein